MTKKDSVLSAKYDIIFLQPTFFGRFFRVFWIRSRYFGRSGLRKKSLIRIRNTAQNEHDLICQLFKILKPVKDRDAPKNSPPTILVRGVCGAEYLLIHILLQCGQFGGCHDE